MKKWIAVLVCAGLASVSLYAANDPKEEQAVLATLKALSQASIHQDAEAMKKIFHDNVSYGHSTGERQTKAEIVAETKVEKREAWDFNDPTVTIIGSTAIVRAIMVSSRYPDNDPKKPLAVSKSNVMWVMAKGPGPHGWQIVGRQNFRPPTPGANSSAGR